MKSTSDTIDAVGDGRTGLRRRISRRGREGQATIEMAMIFPLFLFLFIGMLEVGNAWIASSTAAQAAKEAAEWARRQEPFIGTAVFSKANEIATGYATRFIWTQPGWVVASTFTKDVGGQRMLEVNVDLRYRFITGRFLRDRQFGPGWRSGFITIKRRATVVIHDAP